MLCAKAVFCQIQTEEPVSAAFLDPRIGLFIGDVRGNVYRYNLDGTPSALIYSPPKPARVTLLDASNPLRIFLYYEDLQEYVLLDRFLTETARYSLNELSTFAGICAPSQNNQVWMLDLQMFSLRKIDPLNPSGALTIPLEQILDPEDYDITHMQEYQNLLFFADLKRGVYIFDNMGNLVQHIDLPGISRFSFYDNKLLMVSGKTQLMRYDLYSGELSQELLSGNADFYFEGSDAYIISGRNLTVQEFN